MDETGYERAKRLESEAKSTCLNELKLIAENFHNDPDYIAKRAFNLGIQKAMIEISGWEQLNIMAYEQCKPNFSDLKEATREHENQMRRLCVIKAKLEKKLI